MKVDTIKALSSYLFAFAVLGAAFYGLVLYEFTLDDLVKGALIAWGGAAIAFVFAQESAKATSAQNQRAFEKGLETPTPTGTTVTPQADATTTTTVTSEPAETATFTGKSTDLGG